MKDAVAPSRLNNVSPRFEILAGGVTIFSFFGLFLSWSAIAPLDAGSYAAGQVVVSGNRQAVQHREGGVVRAIHVAEGDQVRSGQILFELNVGELRATERGLAGQVFALLAQRARLVAERDGLAAIAPPAEFAGLSSEEDRALAKEAMLLQERQFNARDASRSTERAVLRQRVSQLEDQRRGYERQIEANTEQRRLIGEELNGLRSLASRGYAPLTRVRALERTAAQLEGEEGALSAQVASTEEQIGEARLKLIAVKDRLNEDVTDQLRQIGVQINEIQPRLADLQAQVSRANVISPASGQAVGLTVFTPGGVVQPGQTLVEVVPEHASRILVVRINPTDIDNVHVGLEAEVRFPGLREQNPPIIRGRVERLSGDVFTDEITGANYYRAEIVVPPAHLKLLGALSAEVRPGMPVEVVVLLRKRTALAYLLEPLVRSFWRSGSEL